MAKIAAFSAHLLTTGGAVAGLLALDAIAAGRIRTALGFMALSVAVDSVDGAFARRVRVSEVLPQIDGALLDNLVDYLNYAVVPAWLLVAGNLLPRGGEMWGAALVLVATALQMSHAEAKTDDHRFRGFPSYWNIVALYLLVLALDPWVNLAIVVSLSGLSLAPVYFAYPSRTTFLRGTTLAFGALWGGCVVALIVEYPEPRAWLAWASLSYVAYHAALGVRFTLERRAPQNAKLR